MAPAPTLRACAARVIPPHQIHTFQIAGFKPECEKENVELFIVFYFSVTVIEFSCRCASVVTTDDESRTLPYPKVLPAPHAV